MRRLVPSEEDCWIIKDVLTKIIQNYQYSFVYQVWKYLNCVTVPSHDKNTVQGTTVYDWSLRSLGGPQIHPPSHVTYHAAHARSTREHQDEDIDPWWMMEPRKNTPKLYLKPDVSQTEKETRWPLIQTSMTFASKSWRVFSVTTILEVEKWWSHVVTTWCIKIHL